MRRAEIPSGSRSCVLAMLSSLHFTRQRAGQSATLQTTANRAFVDVRNEQERPAGNV
jgi:hypothetical protein